MEPFKQKPKLSEDVKIIKGAYHIYRDWKMDPSGYFLIRANKKKRQLELAFCKKDNVIEVLITGDTPQELYHTAIQNGLLSDLEHAAYLGKELEKAYLCLKSGKEYVQDEELEL